MCGRYSFSVSAERIKQQFPEVETGEKVRTSYNIAPTQHAYVITDNHPKRLQYLTWGLIPHWSRDGKNTGKLINARREGISGKPSFRIPIRSKRCIVLADSIYEWRRIGANKVPYRIFMKNGELMEIAGIWDIWQDGEYPVKSFSIITTEPNAEMSGVHSRMPVIFENKIDRERWLQKIPLPEIMDLMKTPSDDILKMYRVSEKVNSVTNNYSELHQELPDLPEMPTLF